MSFTFVRSHFFQVRKYITDSEWTWIWKSDYHQKDVFWKKFLRDGKAYFSHTLIIWSSGLWVQVWFIWFGRKPSRKFALILNYETVIRLMKKDGSKFNKLLMPYMSNFMDLLYHIYKYTLYLLYCYDKINLNF